MYFLFIQLSGLRPVVSRGDKQHAEDAPDRYHEVEGSRHIHGG
jgi:hypothetical protein